MEEQSKKNIPASLENWKFITNIKINKNLPNLDDALTILRKCYEKSSDK